MTKPPRSPQAEQLADAILGAAGSGLRHYTMHSIREAILDAAQKGIDVAPSEAERLKTLNAELAAIIHERGEP